KIFRRKIQLLDKRIWIFDILRREQVRSNYDAVCSNFVGEKPQSLGVVIKIVVVKSADVLLERPRSLQLHRTHVEETMLDSRKNKRECASAVRQYDIKPGK